MFRPKRACVSRIIRPIFMLLIAVPLIITSGHAQTQPPPCASDTAFSWLDFWLGDWDVLVQGKLAGTDHVAKILDGCAVTEDWTASSGRHGHSLFYFEPSTRVWKQVWITDRALGPGGLKEKVMTERFPDGGIRFQGAIPLTDSTSYLDRTTLTPIDSNQVRQVIEISTDGGSNWQKTFDAVYRHRMD